MAPISGHHAEIDLSSDRKVILKELTKDSNVFSQMPGRQHSCFENEPEDLFTRTNAKELHRWIAEKKKQYSNKKWVF